MHIACLDTESTSTGKFNEILELAIYSARGELILNSLYKPKRNRRWPHSERVHGISPLMVQDKPHFQDCLRKIQKIFDRSQMVLGFALDNDIRILEQSGVTGLVPEKCLDVRELFWGVYGDELAMDFYHVPSLIKCAEFCGYVWEEGSAHSAAADAKATLYCYEVLMRKFIQKYELCQLPDEQEKLTDEQIYLGWRRLQEMVRVELHNRAVEKAKGWLYLIDCPEGVLLVARKKPLAARKSKTSADGTGAGKDTGIAAATATGNDAYGAPSRGEAGQSKSRVLAGIELADYAKGYDVMYARFKDKMLPHGPGEKNYYRLTEADIEEFKLYTNVFEA
ncbi:MAG: hypothetical protein IIW41_05630 [Selenomonadaceae bacterium]|nr:hypothetical protein [Selenomonadaceae bacterium]